MAIVATPIFRVFTFNGMTLPDPNPQLTIAEVQDMYATQYPELANAKAKVEAKPGPNGEKQISFTVAVGTKG